jgi:uncharacterized protein YgiM (DUF1202 family)
VQRIRNEPSLVRTSAVSSKVNAQASLKAGTPMTAGASVYARIPTKVYAQPKSSSKVIGTLKKSEEAIASGEEQDGFVKIDAENVSGGWVQRSLVQQQQALQ